ncbi:MAG: hypothetical protein U0X20_20870 [Caldilineaceae bacterium]
MDPNRAALYIDGGPDAGTGLGELQLVAGGTPLSYSEEQATAILPSPKSTCAELDLGDGQSTVWTSDSATTTSALTATTAPKPAWRCSRHVRHRTY